MTVVGNGNRVMSARKDMKHASKKIAPTAEESKAGDCTRDWKICSSSHANYRPTEYFNWLCLTNFYIDSVMCFEVIHLACFKKVSKQEWQTSHLFSQNLTSKSKCVMNYYRNSPLIVVGYQKCG